MDCLIFKKLKLFIVVEVVKIISTFYIIFFHIPILVLSVSHLNFLCNYWLFPNIVILWLLHLYMDKGCCFEKVRQVTA